MPITTVFLTPKEVAGRLKVSVETVKRRFENREGVVNLGSPEMRHKRRYRVLRIPEYCFNQYVHELQNKA